MDDEEVKWRGDALLRKIRPLMNEETNSGIWISILMSLMIYICKHQEDPESAFKEVMKQFPEAFATFPSKEDLTHNP